MKCLRELRKLKKNKVEAIVKNILYIVPPKSQNLNWKLVENVRNFGLVLPTVHAVLFCLLCHFLNGQLFTTWVESMQAMRIAIWVWVLAYVSALSKVNILKTIKQALKCLNPILYFRLEFFKIQTKTNNNYNKKHHQGRLYKNVVNSNYS